jgi:hypothetical protein
VIVFPLHTINAPAYALLSDDLGQQEDGDTEDVTRMHFGDGYEVEETGNDGLGP